MCSGIPRSFFLRSSWHPCVTSNLRNFAKRTQYAQVGLSSGTSVQCLPGSTLVLVALWLGLFLLLTLLVHTRFLAPLDEAGLSAIAALRPTSMEQAVGWIFRLGFAQVDAAVAVVWAAALLILRRSLLAALPPLVLFAGIGAQAGLRLIVDQPSPTSSYAYYRPFASQPVGYALDRADTVARETFVAAVAPEATTSRNPGTFPSGHALRSLFLALLAAEMLRRSTRWRARLGYRLPLAILIFLVVLVGYSAMFYGYHWPSDILGGYLLALALYHLASIPQSLAPDL